MFTKKKSKDKQENEEPAAISSPQPATSYGGQPDVGGGLDTSAGKGGIIDKFSTGRRRLKENIAQKTGKEVADNSAFEERVQRIQDLQEKVTKVRDAVKRQLDCSRALCLACADLGNACSDAGVRDVQFQNTQFQLDEDMRKNLDEAVAKALESLNVKLTPFAELDKMVHSRQRLKLDYDHYTRKVRDLKEKPSQDAAKLSNNEAKLTAARQRLQEATSKLYKGFGYYDAIGGRLCQPEVEMLKRAQQDFFGAAMTAVSVFTPRDPVEVAKEIEAIGKDGMNAPLDLHGSEHGLDDRGGGLASMRGMSGAIRDTSRDDSPDRSPSSAYVPSSSAPWLTTTTPGTGGVGAGAVGWGGRGPASAATPAAASSASSYKSPGSGSTGSWWDKHAATGDTQPAAGWGAGAGVGVSKVPPIPPDAGKQRARAQFSYTAADNTELSLVEGEVLTVVCQDDSGWWTGEKNGRKGLFPSNYVSLV